MSPLKVSIPLFLLTIVGCCGFFPHLHFFSCVSKWPPCSPPALCRLKRSRNFDQPNTENLKWPLPTLCLLSFSCAQQCPPSTSICLCLRNIGKGDLRCWKTPAALVFVALTFIAMSLGRYRCVSTGTRWEVFALNAVCYQNLTVSPRDKVEQWLNVSCTHFVYV